MKIPAFRIDRVGKCHKYKITLSPAFQRTLRLYYEADYVKPIAYETQITFKGASHPKRGGGYKALCRYDETVFRLCAQTYSANETLNKIVGRTVYLSELDWGEREKMNVFFSYPEDQV